MAPKTGQIIRRGPQMWVVRISVGRDPEKCNDGVPRRLLDQICGRLGRLGSNHEITARKDGAANFAGVRSHGFRQESGAAVSFFSREELSGRRKGRYSTLRLVQGKTARIPRKTFDSDRSRALGIGGV